MKFSTIFPQSRKRLLCNMLFLEMRWLFFIHLWESINI